MGSARAAVRFHTETENPLRSKFAAIPRPMIPIPKTATRIIFLRNPGHCTATAKGLDSVGSAPFDFQHRSIYS
jgi:hypothetical protein